MVFIFMLEYQRQLKEQQEYEQKSVEIFPEPVFVVKSRLVSGEKLFINVCSAPEIPAPHLQPVEGEEYDERTRVPLSCAQLRKTIDARLLFRYPFLLSN